MLWTPACAKRQMYLLLSLDIYMLVTVLWILIASVVFWMKVNKSRTEFEML